jgi:hypothetical protein
MVKVLPLSPPSYRQIANFEVGRESLSEDNLSLGSLTIKKS